MVGGPLVPSHMVWGRREVHDIWWDVLSYQATWFGGGGRCMTYGGMSSRTKPHGLGEEGGA